MTGEEFQKEYQLQAEIDHGQVVSHRALDASGEPVLVHYLVEDEAGSRDSLLNYLPRLDSTRASLIRVLTEVDGTTVLVTELLEGFTSLPAWLEEAAGGKVVRDPGIYTRLLGHLGDKKETGELDATAVLETPVGIGGMGDLGETAVLETPIGIGGMGDVGETTVLETPPGMPAEDAGEDAAEDAGEEESAPPSEPPRPSSSKPSGRPGAFTMVFGEDHGLRDASPEDVPSLAETRVTPTSGNSTGTPGPQQPPVSSGSEPPPGQKGAGLAETRMTPTSGTRPPTSGTRPPSSGTHPPTSETRPATAETASSVPARSSMSPTLVVVLVVLALVVGIVAGVFLLG